MKRSLSLPLVVCCLALVFALSPSSRAMAEEFSASRTNIVLKGGISFPPKDHYREAIFLGFGVDFFLSPCICLEVGISRFSSEVSSLEFDDFTDQRDLDPGTLAGYPLQLSLKYQFPTGSRFVPYLLAGGDLVLYDHQVDLSDWEKVGFTGENKMKIGFGFHGGLGLNIFITPGIAFNIDTRYTYTITGFTWTFTDLNHPEITVSGEVNNLKLHYLMATAGIKIYF